MTKKRKNQIKFGAVKPQAIRKRVSRRNPFSQD